MASPAGAAQRAEARDRRLAPGNAFCACTDGLTDRHHDPGPADGRRLLRVAAQAYSGIKRLVTGDELVERGSQGRRLPDVIPRG